MKKFAPIFVLSLAIAAAAQGPAYPYTVPNTWTLSTTPATLIAGQNLYRAPFASGACGTWVKLTATLLSNSATTYTDSISPAGDGLIWCYAASAVGTNGKESTFDIFDPVAVPPAPPTNETATVAKVNGKFEILAKWKQSASPNIASNRIYISTSGKPPFNLRDVTTKPATSATTKNLGQQPGQRWVYITAMSPTGESGLSLPARVTIP